MRARNSIPRAGMRTSAGAPSPKPVKTGKARVAALCDRCQSSESSEPVTAMTTSSTITATRPATIHFPMRMLRPGRISRDRSRSRGQAIPEPSAESDAAPQLIVAVHEVRRREPQPNEVPLARRLLEILVGRALVEDHRVLEELHVSGQEFHVEIELRVVGRTLHELEGLALLDRHRRNAGKLLRAANVPGNEGRVEASSA